MAWDQTRPGLKKMPNKGQEPTHKLHLFDTNDKKKHMAKVVQLLDFLILDLKLFGCESNFRYDYQDEEKKCKIKSHNYGQFS